MRSDGDWQVAEPAVALSHDNISRLFPVVPAHNNILHRHSRQNQLSALETEYSLFAPLRPLAGHGDG
jgi:hypothetical protein